MQSIQLSVVIDPSVSVLVPDSIMYETGASRAQAADPDLFVYEHHGEGFSVADPGALTSFYEDLTRGRALPLRFCTRQVHDVDTLLALCLFLRRDLALSPRMAPLVAQVDLVHRRGFPWLAHLDIDLCRLLRSLRALFPGNLSKAAQGRNLSLGLEWLEGYLVGDTLPDLAPWVTSYPVVESVGTGGFVVARTDTPHALESWVELYRMGYLRGVLWLPGGVALVGRKSACVPLDLEQAALLLSDQEGRPWRLEGDWLWSPGPTVLPESAILFTLTRC